MTQPNLLELAKQGDETAIIAVMNYFLKEKDVTAQAAQKDDCLLVVLKSDQLPDQQSSVAFIHKLMMKLGIESIKSVKVYGKQTGQSSPGWTESLVLTYKVQEPDKQTKPSQPAAPGNRKAPEANASEETKSRLVEAISNQWPAWFPYPSSWLRTFALVLWMGVILRIAGFWSFALGGVLAAITAQLELLLAFLGLGLLVSVLAFSYLHHFLFGKSLPRSTRWLPHLRSLWEGVYAPIVMLLAFISVLIILIPFIIPNCNYQTAEQIGYCVELTGKELVKHQYRMDQIGSIIWFVSAVYLYQAEYLIRHRFISKLKVALQSNPFLRRVSEQKPQNLSKKLLIILLIPLVAVGIYLFSQWSKLQKNLPLPIPSQALSPAVIPSPVTSQSPAQSPQLDVFQNAVNKAMSAATQTQSAKSKDEWNLVASEWQEAIALMKAVPPSHSQHTVAQQKAIEYQRNLDYAQKNATNGQ